MRPRKRGTPVTTPNTNSKDTNVIEIDDDVAVGNKRKLKYAIWQEFGQVKVGNVWKAKCSWCQKLLSGNSGGCPHHSVMLETHVFDQNLARKKLALMICLHEYPLSIVDHAGFHKFCDVLQPLFKLMSRNTIRKDILEVLTWVKEKRPSVTNTWMIKEVDWGPNQDLLQVYFYLTTSLLVHRRQEMKFYTFWIRIRTS
ncbi:P0560B06.12 [Oryza sativa Japonica Group]|uniref:p0560B06.12 protein n=1 Tax=Oryza sativa subsp. japonica TaxID=39947 RepID=Q93VV2_ORYSJ|nr:P0560B06.12 [Oryza sativa Japonica Group]